MILLTLDQNSERDMCLNWDLVFFTPSYLYQSNIIVPVFVILVVIMINPSCNSMAFVLSIIIFPRYHNEIISYTSVKESDMLTYSTCLFNNI
jgi:hypothetical protein